MIKKKVDIVEVEVPNLSAMIDAYHKLGYVVDVEADTVWSERAKERVPKYLVTVSKYEEEEVIW